MAELTFRSPGVGTREIDLSGPTAIKPQGTPAGIIGTSLQGPAFVPQTVATWQDFVAIFGATDGEKLGPLAMYEWMKNARAGTFLRVLGVGTGEKRSTAGTSDSDGNSIEAGGVKNAGYTVGQRLVKGNGYVGDNPFAVASPGGVLGRTYMLGAFMSASAGSSLFLDTGLQSLEGAAAGATATLKFTSDGSSREVATGEGAVLSAGTNTSAGGVYVTTTVGATLADDNFSIVFAAGTPATLTDVAGNTLQSRTINVIMANSADVSGMSPATDEIYVAAVDGNGAYDSEAVLADILKAALEGENDNANALNSDGINRAFGACVNYGTTAANICTPGAGGDKNSVFIGEVVNTQGLKISLRGSQGSGAETVPENYGAWGGAWASAGTVVKCTVDELGLCNATGDQTMTAGNATSATTITLTDAAAATEVLTANSSFYVQGHATDATADTNTQTQIAASTLTNWSATSATHTTTFTCVGDANEAGNSDKLAYANAAAGTFTNQGTANGADEYFTGGRPGSIDAVPILRGVIMCPSGVIASLSGTYTSNEPGSAAAHSDGTGAGGWIGNVNLTSTLNYEFTMLLNGHIDTEAYPNRVTASLSPLSPSYLPNILNTDPMKIQEAGHLLYNYYDVHPRIAVITGSGILARGEYWTATGSNAYEPVAFLLTSSQARNTGTSTVPNFEGFQDRFRTAFSPWVTSQKFGADNKNLFKIHALDDGLNGSELFRIQVENLKNGKLANSYGQFDVLVKRITPPDGVPPSEDGAIETFNGVNLDPTSDNYIARRIGDYSIYYDFDKMAGNQRVVVEGTHPNMSKYIRVQMHGDVTNRNIDNTTLPIGYRGPNHLVTSGSSIFTAAQAAFATDAGGDSRYIQGSGRFQRLNEPPQPQRRNLSLGTDPSKDLNARLPWGFQFETVNSVTEPNKSSNVGRAGATFSMYYPHFQTVNQKPWVGDNSGVVDSAGTVFDSDRFNQNVFTMERIQIHTKSSADTVDAKEWAFADYRRNGKLSGSIRKEDGTWDQGRFLNVNKDFSDPASTKFLKFTFPLQGGFNGVNIFDKEKSKLSNLAAVREMEDENQGQASGPTIKTYMKALDVMAEKSDVDVQILAVPGIRETKITDHALTKTEERFDAIYIMDIEERDALNNVVTASHLQPISVGNTVDDFKSRVLDSSFGAAYFPDVLVTDPVTLTNVRCAPSVAVIGAFAHNDKVAYPWFAPAGFTRGALGRVVQSTVNLSRGNLDSLYDADVNPLTKFPTSEGVVVFGQKTLLAAASSLDRVNVRRLLIDIRRKVRRIADTFLFEPNRADTLARFSAAVNPVLTRIQQQQGLDRFKVIIDTTTTTQADVENNTIRGKIFLQPTRSIEFISLDFVVTNNGTEI